MSTPGAGAAKEFVANVQEVYPAPTYFLRRGFNVFPGDSKYAGCERRDSGYNENCIASSQIAKAGWDRFGWVKKDYKDPWGVRNWRTNATSVEPPKMKFLSLLVKTTAESAHQKGFRPNRARASDVEAAPVESLYTVVRSILRSVCHVSEANDKTLIDVVPMLMEILWLDDPDGAGKQFEFTKIVSETMRQANDSDFGEYSTAPQHQNRAGGNMGSAPSPASLALFHSVMARSGASPQYTMANDLLVRADRSPFGTPDTSSNLTVPPQPWLGQRNSSSQLAGSGIPDLTARQTGNQRTDNMLASTMASGLDVRLLTHAVMSVESYRGVSLWPNSAETSASAQKTAQGEEDLLRIDPADAELLSQWPSFRGPAAASESPDHRTHTTPGDPSHPPSRSPSSEGGSAAGSMPQPTIKEEEAPM